MVDGYNTINTIIEFRKLGSSSTNSYQTDIMEYDESAFERNISYKKIVGGMIIPTKSTAISKEIEFKFVVTDLRFDKFINDSLANSVEEFDTYTPYKITIIFYSALGSYVKVFYNATVIEASTEIDDDVLIGSIKFSLPMKNYSGYPNFYILDNQTNKTSKDSIMGY